MRWVFGTIAGLVLVLTVHVTPSGAASAKPELVLPARPVRATDDFRWQFRLGIRNPLEYGLFVDTMWVEVLDRDPGVTGGPRRRGLPLNIARRSRSAISAGDSLIFGYTGDALSENATLTISLRAHTGTGKKYACSGTVEMEPSPQLWHEPSVKVTVAGRSIEMVRHNSTGGGLNSGPGLVIVHGDGSHARRMIPTALRVASNGFSYVIVSLPGYGLSAGPTEIAGPVSIAAIEAALDTLRRFSGIDTTRIAIWGVGVGAAAAAVVAQRQPTLAAAVFTAGVFDLEAVERDTRSASLRTLIRRDAGKTPADRRQRAPIERASALRMPVLLVHSPVDSVASLSQARAYESALRSNGADVQLIERPGAGRFSTPDAEDPDEIIFLVKRVLMRDVLNR